MNALEKADTILFYLLSIPQKSAGEFYMHNKFFDAMTEIEYEAVINQLIEDKYIFKNGPLIWDNKGAEISDTLITLTIRGEFFISQKGYSGELERTTQEKTWVKNNSDQIRILTAVIALGTLIAAIYYLVELVKWWCNC